MSYFEYRARFGPSNMELITELCSVGKNYRYDLPSMNLLQRHMRRSIFGQSVRHPSQGRIEKLFQGGTVYRCKSTVPIPFLKMPQICKYLRKNNQSYGILKIPQKSAFVFPGGPILRPFILRYILYLPNHLKEVLINSPVFVHVGDHKRILADIRIPGRHEIYF